MFKTIFKNVAWFADLVFYVYLHLGTKQQIYEKAGNTRISRTQRRRPLGASLATAKHGVLNILVLDTF
jgi:hypothetical protein